jgi:hypothetical protein
MTALVIPFDRLGLGDVPAGRRQELPRLSGAVDSALACNESGWRTTVAGGFTKRSWNRRPHPSRFSRDTLTAHAWVAAGGPPARVKMSTAPRGSRLISSRPCRVRISSIASTRLSTSRSTPNRASSGSRSRSCRAPGRRSARSWTWRNPPRNWAVV